ncbi:MAG: FecR domain-containing protein, partial [Desulfobulbus sp.]|nr:FecR domain-containing protein [Desulfobulbus sp.]
MDRALRFLCLLLAAGLGLLALAAPAWSLEDRAEIMVGRISFIEGDLLRYVPEEKDWTQTVADAPFGLEDTLYSSDNGRSELIMPNGTWMRIGQNTQVQMIDLVADATTIDVASGQARFENKSSDTLIKATTPFGSVVAPAGAAFDLYVGDESLEVIAVRGEVEFLHDVTGQRYPVREGSDSVIADKQTVTSGNGTVDGDWDDWNNQRESLWAQRRQAGSTTANLLPAPIRPEAYTLEENGRWERVYYDGAERDMWRPTRVAAGWQPFTVGRWVDYYGDNCWIPAEPFGYMTHHYGSWAYVDAAHAWYWMPPVVRRYPSTPSAHLGFGWYPGRVGWFSRGSEIGWVPLAPKEDYYGYRHWGHRTKVIRHQVPMINLSRYRYLGHASVIGRDHFYSRHRYSDDIRRDFRRDQSFRQFKPMTSWDSFRGDKRRFDFGDREARRKPHTMTSERIRHNQERFQAGGRHDRQRIAQDMGRAKAGRELQRREERHSPFVSNKMVDADQRSRPLDRSTLPRKEFKSQDRERRPSRDNQFGGGRNPERGPDRPSNIEDRRDRLQHQPGRGEERGQGPVSPRDRKNRQVDTQGQAGSDRSEGRQHGPRDPQEVKDRRNQDRPNMERNRDRQQTELDRQNGGIRTPQPNDRSEASAGRERIQQGPRAPREIRDRRNQDREQVDGKGANDRSPSDREQRFNRQQTTEDRGNQLRNTPQDSRPDRRENAQGRRLQTRQEQDRPQQVDRGDQDRRQQKTGRQAMEQRRQTNELGDQRQQQENQGRLERQQQLQRQQQNDQRRQQQQEMQRRQQDDQRRQQQQEMQRRQQDDQRRQQQQEMQRRQQDDQRRQQQQELQRRQQDDQRRQQQQQQLQRQQQNDQR